MKISRRQEKDLAKKILVKFLRQKRPLSFRTHTHRDYMCCTDQGPISMLKYRNRQENGRQCGQISPSKGWVSIDRSMKAALLGTTPRPKAKSSTNDFVSSRSKYGYQRTGQTCITDCLSLLLWRNHLSQRLSILLPRNTRTPTISLHIWTGFGLRGVQSLSLRW